MKNLYFVMEESVVVEGTAYPTFAIVNPAIGVVHDVTCDRAQAYEMVHRFNACNLEPIHLFDAIEDSIV